MLEVFQRVQGLLSSFATKYTAVIPFIWNTYIKRWVSMGGVVFIGMVWVIGFWICTELVFKILSEHNMCGFQCTVRNERFAWFHIHRFCWHSKYISHLPYMAGKTQVLFTTILPQSKQVKYPTLLPHSRYYSSALNQCCNLQTAPWTTT